VILMDIQMPLMDGIEATKKIREAEVLTQEHVQIIALTAHALSGDRERFLAVGMDEYIAKPVQMDDLFRKLEDFTAKQRRMVLSESATLMVNEVGDPVLVTVEPHISKTEELAAFESIAVYLKQIILAKATCETEVIEGIAHSIKSLASSIDANELKNAAFKVELAARRGDLYGAIEYIAQIEQMLQTYQKSKIIS